MHADRIDQLAAPMIHPYRRASSGLLARLGMACSVVATGDVDKPDGPSSLGRGARTRLHGAASASRIDRMSERRATMTKSVCRNARKRARSIDFSSSVGKALERKG